MGGIKTENGKNRIIPIHNKILPFIKTRYNTNNKYLIVNENGSPLNNHQYNTYFNKIKTKLNLNKTTHELRHTFRTALDTAGANKRCIDLLMGHKSQDIGERVYTHKAIEELKTLFFY